MNFDRKIRDGFICKSLSLGFELEVLMMEVD